MMVVEWLIGSGVDVILDGEMIIDEMLHVMIDGLSEIDWRPNDN